MRYWNHLFFVAVSSLTACNRHDVEWLDVGHTPEMRFYIAKQVEVGSRTNSPFIGVKTLWDFNRPKSRAEGDYQSVIHMLLIDCRRQMDASISYTNYSGSMATGSIVAAGGRDIKKAETDLTTIDNPVRKAIADYACSGVGK